VESLRLAIESFENMVKAETEAGRMPNQLIGGILSIEVSSFFWNILFLYQMMLQHVVAWFSLGLQRHNNNFAVPRSIIFAMIYLTDQVRTLIYSQGHPRNSDSFNLSKVSMAIRIHLTGFKKGHCFSMHGLALHAGNNNAEVADDPHQEYWKEIWCLPSEQIRHCKEISEPDLICFVDDYIAAEKALERLKKKISIS
jgi:hypothetical protein